MKSFGRGVGVDGFVSLEEEALDDDGRADDGRAILSFHYLPPLEELFPVSNVNNLRTNLQEKQLINQTESFQRTA